MVEALVSGITGSVSVKVTAENTAENFGNPGAAVFATPMLVALMEQAAIAAVKPYLAEGEGTVGTRVDITHLAATPVGMTVRATAKLEDIKGKKLIFSVEAFDDREKVGQGQHERYIINAEPFYKKAAEKA